MPLVRRFGLPRRRPSFVSCTREYFRAEAASVSPTENTRAWTAWVRPPSLFLGLELFAALCRRCRISRRHWVRL
ncbi:hypothetical protein MRX96_019740 [Rhipicephalus microplus]